MIIIIVTFRITFRITCDLALIKDIDISDSQLRIYHGKLFQMKIYRFN